MNNYVETLSDEELELLIGGKKGAGVVKTITKDCPNFIGGVSINVGPISISKNC